jgi:hypothetical protein
MTIHEMTDGEIRREIAKHVASLDSPNADTNALKKHIETFRAELATRLESRHGQIPFPEDPEYIPGEAAPEQLAQLDAELEKMDDN